MLGLIKFSLLMDIKSERILQQWKVAQSKYKNDYIIIPVLDIIARKFKTYCAIHEDLIKIKEYLYLIQQTPSKQIKSALCYAIIALYGKFFTDASQSNKPKLEPSFLFKEESANQNTHNFLMDLRHNFIAHRGSTINEVEVSYLLIPKPEVNKQTELKYSQIKLNSFNHKETNDIAQLIEYLIEQVKYKIQKSGDKAKGAMFEHFTIEQLGALAINNME